MSVEYPPFGELDLMVLDMCDAFFDDDIERAKDLCDVLCLEEDGRHSFMSLLTAIIASATEQAGQPPKALTAILRASVLADIAERN